MLGQIVPEWPATSVTPHAVPWVSYTRHRVSRFQRAAKGVADKKIETQCQKPIYFPTNLHQRWSLRQLAGSQHAELNIHKDAQLLLRFVADADG